MRGGKGRRLVLSLARSVACIAATRVAGRLLEGRFRALPHVLDVTESNYWPLPVAADAWDAGQREEALAQYAERCAWRRTCPRRTTTTAASSLRRTE